MKVQEKSGSGRKADPFEVLVVCMYERGVTVMSICTPVYLWMRW